MPKKLTVKQNLIVYGKLYSVKNLNSRINYLVEELRLQNLLDRITGELSSGQKNRISLAKAIIKDPTVLLLDEPTASLDLKQAQTVMRILRAAADSGIGVVVVIHDIASVRRYVDTVFLLKDGGVAYAGEPKIVLTAERIAGSFDVDFETAEGSISF